jgi:large subunit ribosomal protein L25
MDESKSEKMIHTYNFSAFCLKRSFKHFALAKFGGGGILVSMLALASQRRNKEEKAALLRNQGLIPGVLYGPKTKASSLKVLEKEFQKVYEEAGESSLIQLGEAPVLIREVQRDPVRGNVIHVDFYQPPLDEEIEVTVPLMFQGEALAVRDLGGTLLKNIQEVEVRALPQNLPHEIVVDISRLITFEDKVLIKDLVRESRVEILRDLTDVVAQVVETKDIEEELEQPVVENVEAVEQVRVEKKEEEPAEETPGGDSGQVKKAQ